MANPDSFESLPIPRKALAQATVAGSYRVYKDADNHIVVKAHSALEALSTSGIDIAYKIERDTVSRSGVLDPKAWTHTMPDATPAAGEEAAAVAAAPPPAQNPEPPQNSATPS
jgi:hypothetical protein